MSTIEKKPSMQKGEGPTTEMVKHKKSRFKEKKSACRFFENQVFNPMDLDFGDKQFYNEGWIDQIQQEVKAIQTRPKKSFQVVEKLETYEPKVIGLEVKQTIEMHQEDDTDEKVIELEFEFFKNRFTKTGEEQEKIFNKLNFNVFDKLECPRHRNKIEVYSVEENYFILCKTFCHRTAETRLIMSIYKYEAGPGEKLEYPILVHEVMQPIVSNFACFDPNLLSVIQFQTCLYYFKVVNEFEVNKLTQRPTRVEFSLYKYDMKEEKEYAVDSFLLQTANPSDVDFEHPDQYALSAVFVQKECHFETEEEFLNAQYVALILEYSEEEDLNQTKKPDESANTSQRPSFIETPKETHKDTPNTPKDVTKVQFRDKRRSTMFFDVKSTNIQYQAPYFDNKVNDQYYTYVIRKLSDMETNIFIYDEDPIDCNKPFNLVEVDGEMLDKKGNFIVNIYKDKIHTISMEDDDDKNIRHYNEIHINECNCCADDERQMAQKIYDKYFDSYDVLHSDVQFDYEYQRREIIVDKENVKKIIRHLMDEPEKGPTEIMDNDSITFLLNQRDSKHIMIFNLKGTTDKDDVTIIESNPLLHVLLADQYDETNLHPMVLSSHLAQREFKRQRQLCQDFQNVVVETNIHEEDQNNQTQSIFVSFKDPKNNMMWRTEDDNNLFYYCFKEDILEQEIQFLQLAQDDRKILPRVFKDEENSRFSFQMYDYSVKVKEKFLENEDGEPVLNPEWEDVQPIQFTEVIDLSTAKLEFEETQAFLSPSTSVYTNYGKHGKQYSQNFMVLISPKGNRLGRLFEYRCAWVPTKDSSKPFKCFATQIGMRYLVHKFELDNENSGLYPIFDDKLMINGCHYIQSNRHVVKIMNHTKEEIQFSNEVCTGFFNIQYCGHYLDKTILIVGAQFTEAFLSQKHKFQEFEVQVILRMILRTLLNVVPYDLIDSLLRPQNEKNFLQPQEIIGAQSFCDYSLSQPEIVRAKLDKMEEVDRVRRSLLGAFLEEQLVPEDIERFYEEDTFFPSEDEVSTDMFCMSPIARCFDIEFDKKALEVTIDLLIGHIIKSERNKFSQLLLTNLMPKLLMMNTPSVEYRKFFIDSPDAEENQGGMFPRFTWMLVDDDMPEYDFDPIVFKNYDDYSKLLQVDIQQYIKQYILDDAGNQEIANNKIKNFYVDLRSLGILRKLQSFSSNHSITTNDPTETDLSNYLWMTVNQYGEDIENQASVRNLIDSLYVTTKKVYTSQFVMFFVLFVVPLVIQVVEIDVTDASQRDVAYWSNFVCMFTNVMFFFNSMIQLFNMGFQTFFNSPFAFFDIGLFVSYTAYFILTFYTHEESQLTQIIRHGQDESEYIQQVNEFHKNDSVWEFTIMIILQLLLIIFTAVKCLFFIRVHEVFFEPIWLMGYCMVRIIPITCIFYFWLMIFGVFFRVLGVNTSLEDYPLLSNIVIYGVYTYRNAVGDIQAPQYKFWETRSQTTGDQTHIYIFLALIWLFWLLNQFFVFIFFLNYLIAQIAQVYEEMISKSLVERYKYKCIMNRECRITLSIFSLVQKLRVFILQADCHSGFASKNWQGVVHTLKTFISDENYQNQNKMEDLFNKISKDQSKEIQTIQEKLENMDDKISNIEQNLESKLAENERNHKALAQTLGGVEDSLKEVLEKLSKQIKHHRKSIMLSNPSRQIAGKSSVKLNLDQIDDADSRNSPNGRMLRNQSISSSIQPSKK